MEQRDINFLKMTSGVISGMDSEKPLWDKEVEIVNVFTGIKTKYGSIESANQEVLGVDLTGLTGKKDNIFNKLTSDTFKLCNKMSAYAKINKNYELLPLVDLSLSAIRGGIEMEAVERCLAIVNKASTMLTQLATFKVTEAELTGIKAQITEYKASVNARTSSSGSRTVSGEEIEAGIAVLREQLDILDNLIIGMIDDESFVARYHSWRRIVDYGTDKTLPNKPKPGEKAS